MLTMTIFTVKKELLDVGKEIIKNPLDMRFQSTIANEQYVIWSDLAADLRYSIIRLLSKRTSEGKAKTSID